MWLLFLFTILHLTFHSPSYSKIIFCLEGKPDHLPPLLKLFNVFPLCLAWTSNPWSWLQDPSWFNLCPHTLTSLPLSHYIWATLSLSQFLKMAVFIPPFRAFAQKLSQSGILLLNLNWAGFFSAIRFQLQCPLVTHNFLGHSKFFLYTLSSLLYHLICFLNGTYNNL